MLPPDSLTAVRQVDDGWPPQTSVDWVVKMASIRFRDPRTVIEEAAVNIQQSQGLGAASKTLLSRTCLVAGSGLVATLRYVA